MTSSTAGKLGGSKGKEEEEEEEEEEERTIGQGKVEFKEQQEAAAACGSVVWVLSPKP